jgi:8-oxo-dGTP pyrophosphatase MutT (NUDIX family)
MSPPETNPPKIRTPLDLVNDCDSFPYINATSEYFSIAHLRTYYHLRVSTHPEVTLGYLLPSVALTLTNLPDWHLDPPDPSLSSEDSPNPQPRTVTLITGNNEKDRSTVVAKTCEAMRLTGHWKVLEKWRNELYPVYGPNQELLFKIERSASPLFGVVTYGVHMTGYFYEGGKEEKDLRFWVPTRSRNKQTYGGMLDNTVAGGMSVGEQPLECLVRESAEEASLPADFVRRNAKPVGSVTYFYIRDPRAGGETGLLQPECQYVYDLDMSGVECKPNDDEVEKFEIMNVEQVKEALGRALFKPNCALVMLDFLVRHGVFSKENEPNLAEIVSRLHRRLEFPLA